MEIGIKANNHHPTTAIKDMGRAVSNVPRRCCFLDKGTWEPGWGGPRYSRRQTSSVPGAKVGPDLLREGNWKKPVCFLCVMYKRRAGLQPGQSFG